MVRNTIGGNGHKRVSKGKRRSKNPNLAVDVTTGVDHYAQVQKRLGGNRLSILLDDGQEVQAVIPGKFFKKLWFNPGDFIHVRCESGSFYDVIQKLLDPTEQQNAATALGKKLDDGEHNIFRPDVREDEQDDDFDMDQLNEQNEDDEETGDNFNEDKLSRNERKAQMMRNVTKGSVNVDKFQRKVNEKEREQNRRANAERDFSQIPKSVVKDSDNSTSEESESEVEEGEKGEGDDDVDIDAI